jgi:hypothetical protein
MEERRGLWRAEDIEVSSGELEVLRRWRGALVERVRVSWQRCFGRVIRGLGGISAESSKVADTNWKLMLKSTIFQIWTCTIETRSHWIKLYRYRSYCGALPYFAGRTTPCIQHKLQTFPSHALPIFNCLS